MTIKQNSKHEFEVDGVSVRGWHVHCDNCGKANNRPGADAGDAAEYARKEGFITIPRGINPSDWLCPACQNTKKK